MLPNYETMKSRPKLGACDSCANKAMDCSSLPFEDMFELASAEGVRLVFCSSHQCHNDCANASKMPHSLRRDEKSLEETWQT